MVRLYCIALNFVTAPVPVGSRDRPVHTDDTKTHQKLSAKGSNSSRGSDNGNSMGEGTVVQLPRPAEGERLECDRIIMVIFKKVTTFFNFDVMNLLV